MSMIKRFGLLFSVVTVLFFPLQPVPAWGLDIGQDTVLTEDVKGGIVITANNITLDCSGRTVTGSGNIAGEKGVDLSGRSGVTVKSCNVENFSFGFYLDSSHKNILESNKAFNNGKYGFVLLNFSSYNTFTKNEACKNAVVDASQDGTCIRNIFTDNKFCKADGI